MCCRHSQAIDIFNSPKVEDLLFWSPSRQNIHYVQYTQMLIFLYLYSMTEKNKKENQEIILDLLKETIDQSELKNLYSKDSEHNDE